MVLVSGLAKKVVVVGTQVTQTYIVLLCPGWRICCLPAIGLPSYQPSSSTILARADESCSRTTAGGTHNSKPLFYVVTDIELRRSWSHPDS